MCFYKIFVCSAVICILFTEIKADDKSSISKGTIVELFGTTQTYNTSSDVDARAIVICSFLRKIFDARPFSNDDEKTFFTPAGGGLGMSIYRKLGMFSLERNAWTVSPRFSYIGELVKMNKHSIIHNEKASLVLYISYDPYVSPEFLQKARQPKHISSGEWSYITVVVYDQPPFRNDATVQNLLLFVVRKWDNSYKIELDMSYVGNKSIYELLGFKWINKSLVLPDDKLQDLKYHMEQLK